MKIKGLMISTLVAAALSFVSVDANAVVLDFEDIGGFSGRATFPGLGIENTYAGFQWPTSTSDWPSGGSAAPWAVVDNSDGQFSTVGAYSGRQAVWNFNDGPQREILFGAATDVQGAYFNVLQAQQDWGAATVQFRGYDASDVLIGSSAVLNLDRDNANPAWQWLGANFSGVYRLEIVSSNDRFGGDGWWAMDDLTLGPASVPEPATVALLGIGLLGFVFYRRSR